MEPLISEKVNQLAKMSEKRRTIFITGLFCERRDRHKAKGADRSLSFQKR
jgi:hypothetical protein